MTLDLIDPTLVLIGAAATLAAFLVRHYVVHWMTPTIGRQRESIKAVSKTLMLHAPCIFNPGSMTDDTAREASAALRAAAVDLSASLEAVRFYGALALLRIVRNREAVTNAHRHLVGLANSTSNGDGLQNAAWVAAVEDSLGLETNLGFRKGQFAKP